MGSLFKRTWTDTKGRVHESNVWWIKYYREGRPYRESSGSKKEGEAKRLLRLREGDITRGIPVTPRINRILFDELAQGVVDDYHANEQKTANEVERRLRLHLLPYFGGVRAVFITPADIRQFSLIRKKEGAANATIDRELAIIKRAFNLGAKDGKVMVKPYVPMMKENNVRSGFFERHQFESVRRNLEEPLQAVITFAYITGWRSRSEIQTLQWSQVDFEARRVYLNPGTTKNNDARWFPFTEELKVLLEGQRGKRDELKKEGKICPWVFQRDNGKRIKSFYKAWATACKKAGVPGKLVHDFRRTAVRNLVRAGVPERVTMQLTGHKTRSVFERYNIVSDRDLDEAAKCLDSFMGTVPGTVVPISQDLEESKSPKSLRINTRP
ncbi:site-specific integrase [Acidobacteria bacterium AH-259-A15]|nr:site-specific integrase [Acidobacteria bacterium AH-259-A15]